MALGSGGKYPNNQHNLFRGFQFSHSLGFWTPSGKYHENLVSGQAFLASSGATSPKFNSAAIRFPRFFKPNPNWLYELLFYNEYITRGDRSSLATILRKLQKFTFCNYRICRILTEGWPAGMQIPQLDENSPIRVRRFSRSSPYRLAKLAKNGLWHWRQWRLFRHQDNPIVTVTRKTGHKTRTTTTTMTTTLSYVRKLRIDYQ